MTPRLVKAFVWLQWRLLVNGLKGGRKRDSLERFSRWSDATLPAVATVMLIPAVLLMAAAGGFAGWTLASGSGREAGVAFVLTMGLLVPLFWLLLRPLVSAGLAGVERGELLRLLPIPTSFLRHLELIRAALDPILLLFAAAVLALPLGALVAGRPLVTLVAIVAGAVLLAFFACLSAVLSLGVQVLLRNRRRGEAATLVLFLVLSSIGVIPQLFVRKDRASKPAPTTRSASKREFEIPVAFRFLPSGLYAVGLEDGSTGRGRGASLNLGALAALAALAYAASATLHRRLLDTPETSGSRASRAPVRVRTARWPGLSPIASATAAVQVRTLLRTVRGKMLIISPVFVTILFALVFTRGDMPSRFMAEPAGIAAFVVFLGLANHSSVACNQFAADGSALVLEFLQPHRRARPAHREACRLGRTFRGLAVGGARGASGDRTRRVAGAAARRAGRRARLVLRHGAAQRVACGVLPEEHGPRQAREGRQAALHRGAGEPPGAHPRHAPRGRLHRCPLVRAPKPRAGATPRRGVGDCRLVPRGRNHVAGRAGGPRPPREPRDGRIGALTNRGGPCIVWRRGAACSRLHCHCEAPRRRRDRGCPERAYRARVAVGGSDLVPNRVTHRPRRDLGIASPRLQRGSQ